MWNFLNEEIPKLGKEGVGFDAIWVPPFSKAAAPNSNGYDPYDYFDLGDHARRAPSKPYMAIAKSFEG